MAHKILENNYFKKISVRYLKKVILKKNLINLKKIHTDHWSVFIQISNLYDPYGSVILMGFPLQQKHKFSEKLHRKFKTNSNNHPKIVTNNNSIMQQHRNTNKPTKTINSFKGNAQLTWKTEQPPPPTNNNHHERKTKQKITKKTNHNHHTRTDVAKKMKNNKKTRNKKKLKK